MGRRIRKILVWIPAVIFGLVVTAIALVYLPPVQNFARKKVVEYVNNNDSIPITLSIEKLRLGFPLRLTVRNATGIRQQTEPEVDTLFHAGEVRVKVALWPLIFRRAEVDHLIVEDASFHYADTDGTMNLDARVEHLALHSASVHLKSREADIPLLELNGTRVKLLLEESTDTTTAADTVPLRWKIRARQLKLAEVDYRMEMLPTRTDLSAYVEEGLVERMSVDLGTMIVEAEHLELNKANRFTLHIPTDSPVQGDGFDPSNIRLDTIRVSVDSIYNQGMEVRAAIRNLAFAERSGLEVTSAKGYVAMDSVGYRTQGFQLNTPGSVIKLNAVCGAGISDPDPKSPVELEFSADLAVRELLLLYPVANDTIRRAFANETLVMHTTVSGVLGDLDLQTLRVIMPEVLTLTANGRLGNITNPDRLTAHVNLKGDLTGPEKAEALLPDSTIMLIPLHFEGTAMADAGTYRTQMHVVVSEEGRIDLRGELHPDLERYYARVRIDHFPLYKILATDSLGYLTMGLTAGGRGFDFFAPQTQAKVDLQVDSLDYMDFRYHDIRLQSELAGNKFRGDLSSRNAALRLALKLTGELTEQRQAVNVKGTVFRIDPEQMHLVAEPASFSFRWDAQASAQDGNIYRVRSTMDSMRIHYGEWAHGVQKTVITADAGPGRVNADIQSGDLSFSFHTPMSLDLFAAGLGKTVDTLRAQHALQAIRPDSLESMLPAFDISLTAGQNNIVNHFLRTQGIGFRNVDFKASSSASRPFRAEAQVDQFSTSGITLDTLTFGVRRRNENIGYYLRMANKPGNLSELGFIYLYGRMNRSRATLNIVQRDREQHTGVRVGLAATMQDSVMTVHITPEDPILGFAQWHANQGNYVKLNRYTNALYADLKLETTGKEFSLQSYIGPDMPKGSVQLVMKGLEIGRILRLLPDPALLDGVLGSDITFGMTGIRLAAKGDVTADNLVYDRNRVGDAALHVTYQSDTLAPQQGAVRLTLDKQTALTARAVYDAADSSAYQVLVDMPGLPLRVVNAFMPEQTANFNGTLQGNFQANGKGGEVQVDGELRFSGTSVNVEAIGTTFRLSDNPVTIRNSRLYMDDFTITDPDNNPLTLAGTVDFADMSRILTDLTVRARSFRFIDAPRNRGSMVFGRGDANIYARAKGTPDALDLSGNVDLLTGTDITYVMQDTQTGMGDSSQDMVKFVSFADTSDMPVRRAAGTASGGMNMLFNVGIGEGVKLSMFLDQSGGNRINLAGDGSLTYSMNRQGDTRLLGRYTLSGGNVLYAPPVISAKNFAIKEGGYVEWTGELLEPTFAIEAVETVRTTVTMDGGAGEQVNFEIKLNIEGSLDNMQVAFDLAAPANTALQSQIAGLTPEERANQAMSLLLYHTYSGPGTEAKANTANPLDSFIAKELNQWAQHSLSGVDLSFGVDSYQDASGETTNTDYSYSLSKRFFDDRIRAVIGGRYSTDTDAAENLKDNLMDDITLEYYFSNRENMFIKIFRHSDYESVLEGEIIETGVGFVVRKKMYRLRDLFKISPEREYRRAIRKDIRAAPQKVEPPQAAAVDDKVETE